MCFYRSQESGDKVGKDKASNEALNENELLIVKMIRDNPMIKQKDIIDQTSISRAQVQRIMKSLQERGVISHEASKKAGRWIVNDSPEKP